MNQLVFDDHVLEQLKANLLASSVERCAILFANEVRREENVRLLVTEVDFPEDADYTDQSGVSAVLTPHYVAKVTKRAKLAEQSLVFVHSHPGSFPAAFSVVDDQGERKLADFLAHRDPNRVHGAMVVAEGGLASRILGTRKLLLVISLGDKRLEFGSAQPARELSERHDRQVRAFGRDGQGQIEKLRVGIVGLGGTGSVLAQQLAHLGTRDFLLIDPDCLETTNLNRVVGSQPQDVGRPKVEVAKRTIKLVAPEASVEDLMGDITRASVAQRLEGVDFIFMCTDSHGSRSVAQQVAYQYRIPAIDVGTVIVAREGEVQGIHARVQLLGTDGGCLWCSNLLDAKEIRREMMSEQERATDPYLRGAREPAPAVISINSTAVSLAVTMFLGVVTAAPIEGRYLLYNGKTASLRSVHARAQPDCFICSAAGVRGKGDRMPLFARTE
jgi:molybdopterin/thiamine biosynthesis adenylyltransferase